MLCLINVLADFHLTFGWYTCFAFQPVDLVFLEQKFNALDIGIDDFRLVRHECLVVESNAGNFHAERSKIVLRLFEFVRGLQQGFRGNASHIQAGTAQRTALFRTGNFQAQLRRANRADIAAGSRSDHNDIV